MYEVKKRWSKDTKDGMLFGYDTGKYIIVFTNLYLPKTYGSQAVFELRDKDLNYIKLIGSDELKLI